MDSLFWLHSLVCWIHTKQVWQLVVYSGNMCLNCFMGWIWLIDDLLIWCYSPLSSRLTALACDSTWVTSFLWCLFEYPPKWCTYSAGMAGATWNCCRLSTISVYSIQPCSIHFTQSHICKVYACLAVTCHLHFWQNYRDLLCATVVTRGVERIPKYECGCWQLGWCSASINIHKHFPEQTTTATLPWSDQHI